VGSNGTLFFTWLRALATTPLGSCSFFYRHVLKIMIVWLIVIFLVLSVLITVREGLKVSDMNETPPNPEKDVNDSTTTPVAAAPQKAPGSIDCAEYEKVLHETQTTKAKNQYVDFRYCKSSDNQYCMGLSNPPNPSLPCPFGYKQVNYNDVSEPTGKKGVF
jgi:hypothetical protein